MQTASPKVSIGIPVYNQENFIERCLDSVRNQSYKNIEVFIADDGSKDNSRKIIKAYAEKHSNFFKELIFHKENIGIVKNFNSLLSKTDGEYICIFAGDDYMHPDKISKQVNALEGNKKASFCYTNMAWQKFNKHKPSFTHFGFLRPRPHSIFDLIKDNTLPSPTFLMRKEFIPYYGFDEDIVIINDYKMALDLFEKSPPIYVDEVLTIYNKHEKSLTAQNYYVDDRFRLYAKLKLKYSNNPDLRYNKALKKHKALCAYALIMTLIQQDKKSKATYLLIKTLGFYLYSPKWCFRLVKVLMGLLSSRS